MRLESARSLKAELWAARPTAAAAVQEMRGGIPGGQIELGPPQVAVGIAAVSAGDYRIAVRPRVATARAVEEIDRITAAAAGEVDVRFTGTVMALPATASGAHRGLRIGMSVGHVSTTAGTLGCFVRSPRGIGFISNNHVLAFEDSGREGDSILQPGPVDGGRGPGDSVATLVEPYPSLRPGVKTVDCAFALLRSGIDFDAHALDGGGILRTRVNTVQDRDDVEKIGRTTGRTQGIVSAFDIDGVVVDYPHGGFSVTFDNQIEIESAGSQPFSKPGDSGSIVFNAFFEPVGLLFATALDRDRTYANPLQTVLDALGVELLT